MMSDSGPDSATTRHVLLTLSVHMNGDGGSCYPSVRTLSAETRLHTDTVCRHLECADSDGWIERRRGPLAGQAWRRTEYQATLPEGVRLDRTASADVSAEAAQLAPEGVRPASEKVSGLCGQSMYIEDVHTDGSSGEAPNPPPDANPTPLKRFWAADPRRAGGNPKKAAFRQWRATLRKGVTTEELEEAAGRYAAYCDATGKTGTEYVKQASTFLGRDEHWREDWTVPSEDGPSPEQRYESGRKVLEALEASP